MADFDRAQVILVLNSGKNFRGVDLSGLNLSGLDFRGADLTNTNFSGSDLSNTFWGDIDRRTSVDSIYTEIKGTNFSQAILIGASFQHIHSTDSSNIENSKFDGANLTGALFDSPIMNCTLLAHHQRIAFLA